MVEKIIKSTDDFKKEIDAADEGDTFILSSGIHEVDMNRKGNAIGGCISLILILIFLFAPIVYLIWRNW